MNQDEFLKCLELSKTRYAEGNFESALRLAIKAQRMSDCKETTEWLEKVRKDASKTETKSTEEDKTDEASKVRQRQKMPSPSTSEDSLKQNPSESSQSSYTPEQLKEVKEFMKRNKDDYYKVLGVDKSASLDEIKKAYKKLALKFHPDKNQAPGADEAFKIIAVAFSVLGDEGKRRDFDRFGPSVASNGSANGFSGFHSPFSAGHFGGNGATFSFNGSEEISPEDLFNLFFGSAFSQAQGAHFHQNPFTQAQFGPGQFFFSTNFGGMRGPQQRQQRPMRQHRQPENEAEELLRKFMQFIPLIIVFALSLLSSWIFPDNPTSNTTTNNVNTEHLFSLNPSSKHRFPRNTRLKNVPYFATSNFQKYFEKLKENDSTSKLSRELAAYENIINTNFINGLKQSCDYEERQLSKLLRNAKNDQTKEEIKANYKLNSCEKLKNYE